MTRRFATGVSVALFLAGGVALAQADLIVDPWKRVFAPKAAVPAAPAAPDTPKKAARAESGGFDDSDRTPAPRPVVEPWAPLTGDVIANPWVRRTGPTVTPVGPVAATPAMEEAPQPHHPSNWARVLPEIIDPWGPRRLAAYRDPLIVDPWPN